MRMVLQMRRVVAAGLLGWYLPGCYAWRPAPPSPETISVADSTAAIRIGTSRGRFEVKRPVVDGDSLRGTFLELQTVGGGWTLYAPSSVQALALADITSIEVRRVDGGQTGLAALLGVLVVGGAIAALIVSSVDLGSMGGGGGSSGGGTCGGWGGCSVRHP
jgi:hypothetical protein